MGHIAEWESWDFAVLLHRSGTREEVLIPNRKMTDLGKPPKKPPWTDSSHQISSTQPDSRPRILRALQCNERRTLLFKLQLHFLYFSQVQGQGSASELRGPASCRPVCAACCCAAPPEIASLLLLQTRHELRVVVRQSGLACSGLYSRLTFLWKLNCADNMPMTVSLNLNSCLPLGRLKRAC